jgi:glycerol-3-phosphate dehydrogenase subunit B
VKALVIGAGAAGTACAWYLARRGAKVTLVHDRAGATALYSGALDLEQWGEPARPAVADADTLEFAKALTGWVIGGKPCRIATRSGALRPAAGRALALLDLEPLAGKRIAIADVDRDEWDAPLLARALGAADWAVRTGTRFEAVRVRALRQGHERRDPLWDFAKLHDASERADEFVEQLRKSTNGHDAWLVGPWLGIQPGTADRIRERLKLPIGEVNSPPGGPAGARFEAARDRLLASANVDVVCARVTAIVPSADNVRVELAEQPALEADRVVLAVGGIVAGGLRLAGGVGSRSVLDLGLSAPASLMLDSREVDAPSTLHGLDFQAHGLGALERVGIAVDGAKVRGQSALFAAGDVVAERPRTVLEAVRSGIAAARAAVASGQ